MPLRAPLFAAAMLALPAEGGAPAVPGTRQGVEALAAQASLFATGDGFDLVYLARDKRLVHAHLDRELSPAGEPRAIARAAPLDAVVVDPSGTYLVGRDAAHAEGLVVTRCERALEGCTGRALPLGEGARHFGHADLTWHPRLGEHGLVVEESLPVEGRSGFMHTRLVFFRVAEDGRLVDESRRVLDGPGGPFSGSSLSGLTKAIVPTKGGYAVAFSRGHSGTRPHEVVLSWLGPKGDVEHVETLDRARGVSFPTVAARAGAIAVAWLANTGEGYELRVTQLAAGKRQETLARALAPSTLAIPRFAATSSGFALAWSDRSPSAIEVVRFGDALPSALAGTLVDGKHLLLAVAADGERVVLAYNRLDLPRSFVVEPLAPP